MLRLRRWWRRKKVESRDEDNGQKVESRDEDNGQRTPPVTQQPGEVRPINHSNDDRENLRSLQAQRHIQAQPKKDGQKDEDKEFVWNSNLKLSWTQEEEAGLRKEILKDRKDQNGEKIKMTLLVFGQTGHGKSTLCNGFRSALLGEGRVSHYFQSGTTSCDSSFSRGVQSSRYGGNLRIMDMTGLYETDRFKKSNINDLLCGKVDFDEELNEHLEVCNKNASEPAAGTNNVSCLVLVLRPDKEFGERVQTFMDGAADLVKKGGLSRHAVITFLDKIDPMFKDPRNLPQFLESSKVKEAVKDVHRMTGVPLSAIGVVSNYWNQSRTDLHTNILLLNVLADILYDAKEDHERRIANQAKQ